MDFLTADTARLDKLLADANPLASLPQPAVEVAPGLRLLYRELRRQLLACFGPAAPEQLRCDTRLQIWQLLLENLAPASTAPKEWPPEVDDHNQAATWPQKRVAAACELAASFDPQFAPDAHVRPFGSGSAVQLPTYDRVILTHDGIDGITGIARLHEWNGAAMADVSDVIFAGKGVLQVDYMLSHSSLAVWRAILLAHLTGFGTAKVTNLQLANLPPEAAKTQASFVNWLSKLTHATARSAAWPTDRKDLTPDERKIYEKLNRWRIDARKERLAEWEVAALTSAGVSIDSAAVAKQKLIGDTAAVQIFQALFAGPPSRYSDSEWGRYLSGQLNNLGAAKRSEAARAAGEKPVSAGRMRPAKQEILAAAGVLENI